MADYPKGRYKVIPGFAQRIPSMSTAQGIYARLIGTRETVKNLNIQIAAIKGASLEGLLEAASYIRKDMEVTPPLIPILTNALRASWFVEKHPNSTPEMPLVVAGFGDEKVNYAVYVHEMTSPPYGEVNWTRPGSGPKFLEYAVKRNTKQVLEIVAKNIKSVTP